MCLLMGRFLKPCIKYSADHFVEISIEQNGNEENIKEEALSYVKLPHRLN